MLPVSDRKLGIEMGGHDLLWAQGTLEMSLRSWGIPPQRFTGGGLAQRHYTKGIAEGTQGRA